MIRTRLAVFDMAGTTVDDRIDGLPLVLKSYDDAFRNHGVEVPMMVLNAHRGRDKRTVIGELGGDKADEIYVDFIGFLKGNISEIREMEGAPGAAKGKRRQDSGLNGVPGRNRRAPRGTPWMG